MLNVSKLAECVLFVLLFYQFLMNIIYMDLGDPVHSALCQI